MKYEVKVDYKRFLFDNRLAAIEYAEASKTNSLDRVEVTIRLIDEEKEEES